MTSRKIRVVHYLNRFFAGVGGEEEASAGLEAKPGPIGPARGLQQQLGARGEVVATLFCGDNRVAEATPEVAAEVLTLVKQYAPDVFVAGPAFNAGRYGFASAEICHAVATQAGIPCITGFSPDNPGLLAYRRYKDERVFALPTSETAGGMNPALAAMARLALRLAAGERIGPAAVEGYIPRGLRKEVHADKRGAKRAVEMLMAKLQGAPFTTEVSMEATDAVAPAAPLRDLSHATLGLLSTSGVVPKGNPDKFKHWSNVFWKKYSVAGMARLNPDQWETVHGGYHTVSMFKNPHLGVPLDVLREAEDSGVVGRLHEQAYLFPGETMESKVAKQLGLEIAQDMRASGIEGVVLVSTWGTCTRCGATVTKEIERVGIPVALITAVPTLAQMVGASRIVPGVAIPHPCGNPTLSADEDHALRARIVATALKALQTQVREPTIFEVGR